MQRSQPRSIDVVNSCDNVIGPNTRAEWSDSNICIPLGERPGKCQNHK